MTDDALEILRLHAEKNPHLQKAYEQKKMLFLQLDRDLFLHEEKEKTSILDNEDKDVFLNSLNHPDEPNEYLKVPYAKKYKKLPETFEFSEKAKILTLVFISLCLGYFLGVISRI